METVMRYNPEGAFGSQTDFGYPHLCLFELQQRQRQQHQEQSQRQRHPFALCEEDRILFGGRFLGVAGLMTRACDSEKVLESHFAQFGEIESGKGLRDRYSVNSNGLGEFQDAASIDCASVESHTNQGRRNEMKAAVPKREPGPIKTKRIFVARIPSHVSEDEFRDYFKGFGTVEDAYMPKDHTRQSYRGIGFVTFADASSTESVMAVKHKFGDHEVVVDRATPKESSGSPASPGRYSMGSVSSKLSDDVSGALVGLRSSCSDVSLSSDGYGNGGIGLSGSQLELLQSLRDQQIQGIGVGQPGLGGVIGIEENSSGDVQSPTDMALPPVIAPEIPPLNLPPSQHNQQQQFSPLTTPMMDPLAQGVAMDVANCIRDLATRGMDAVSSTPLMNGIVSNNLMSCTSLQLNPKSQVGMQSVTGTDVSRISHRLDNAHVTSVRVGPRLFVGKLSKETTEQDLREYFMNFGYVMDVYIPRSKDNKKDHRGFGFVTFETEAAIQRVVSHETHKIKGAIIAIDVAVPEQAHVGRSGMEGRRSKSLSIAAVPNVINATSVGLEADCSGGSPSKAGIRARHTFRL